MFEVGDEICTTDGEVGIVVRTNVLGVNDSIVVDINGKLKAYMGSTLHKCSKNVQKKKIAYLFDGPIYYWGYKLTNHYSVSEKMKTLLIQQYDFKEENIKLVRSSPQKYLQEFINEMKDDNVLGLLCYCGHGNQSSSSSESDNTQESWFGISDYNFSKMINTISEKSLLVMCFDSCFSDGMINTELITNNIKYIYYSAARQDGPDNTRSALYTGDGGWLTYNIQDYLENKNDTIKLSYEDLLNNLTSDNNRYYDDNKNNLHWPRIITSDKNLLKDSILFQT